VWERRGPGDAQVACTPALVSSCFSDLSLAPGEMETPAFFFVCARVKIETPADKVQN
jgi:hypothetical protein